MSIQMKKVVLVVGTLAGVLAVPVTFAQEAHSAESSEAALSVPVEAERTKRPEDKESVEKREHERVGNMSRARYEGLMYRRH